MKVSAAIIISNGKILITKRSETMKPPSLWEFPGGKVKLNETPEDCIVREIKEELGVTIKISHHFTTTCYSYSFGDIELISYTAKIISGDIKLREHVDYKWVDINDLVNYDFVPADIPITKKLMEDDNNTN